MRKPLAILTGLALVALVAGCSTAQVSQGPPAPGDMTNVIHGNTATTQPNPGGLSVDTPVNSTNTASDNPVVPISTALPLSKQNARPLTTASFATDQIGFVVSQGGTIYKTTDGGATWTAVYTASKPIVGITSAHETVGGKPYIFAWAWTKNYMLASPGTNTNGFSRVKFDGQSPPGIGSVPIEDVSLFANDFAFFVSNGVVWTSDGMGARWLKRTPPVPVWSVVNLDDATAYAAADGAVYKTTDSGNTWAKVFTAPIPVGRGVSWNVQIEATGNHVAVLFTSSDVAKGHQAYVLYDSNDSGKTWHNLFDERFSDFEQAYYGSMKPLYTHTLSLRPGPFALLPNGDVAMIGMQEVGNVIPTMSVLTPQGKRVVYDPIGPSANSPDVFGPGEMPMAISAPDATHFFVVGGNGNKAVMAVSTDGGLTWRGN